MSGMTIGLGSSAFGALAALAVRSAVLLALGWLGTVLLKRAVPPARQALWVSVIAGVLLLPLLAAVLPAWRVLPTIPWPAAAAVAPGTLLADAPSPQGLSRSGRSVAVEGVLGVAPASAPRRGFLGDWRPLAVILWGAGSALVALSLGLGLLRLRAIRRGARRTGPEVRAESARLARELGVGRRVQVLAADQLASPATWGLLRPVIVLPSVAAHWSVERRRLVLAHEMAHIARNDFAWRLVAQLGCVAYWFNPLVWLAARRLRLEQELACDLAVVARGARPSTYAHHLLSIARAGSGRPLPLVALDMARRSQMEGRLMSILENRSAPSPRRPLLLPALLVLVALPILASAGTRPAPAPEPAEPANVAFPAIAPALAPTPVSSAVAPVTPPAAPVAPATLAAPLSAVAAAPAVLAHPTGVSEPVASPLPVLAALDPVPRPAPAPAAPRARIAGTEPAVAPAVLAPAVPGEPSETREMEIDPETRRIEEEIARRAAEIADLVAPLHEEIARAMEERIEPILERMELVQLEMEPVHEEMGRIGEEMSRVLESEMETQIEAEELGRKAEALALEAVERARLSGALVGAEGAEREHIEQALREAEVNLAPLREEMEALRLGMAERHRASADEMRARLEPYRAQMEALRESMVPERERMEQLRAELEPIRKQLEASREARMEAMREQLETLRRELEVLRREREARRSGEGSR